MKYSDNQEIMLGDYVNLGGEMIGTIVCCFKEKQFAPNFNPEDWISYTTGIMIDSPQGGLVYYLSPTPDLSLIERG